MKRPVMIWLPLAFVALAFVPLTAWSKDATVLILFLGAVGVAANDGARRAMFSRWPLQSLVGVAAVAFIAWSLLSLAWAPHQPIIEWLKSIAVAVMGWMLGRGLICIPADILDRTARGVVAAAVALLILLAVERLTGAAIIGLARPEQSAPRLFDELSAGLAFLCCLAFPVARLIAVDGAPGRGAALIAAVLVLALSYNMDAAPFAVAAGMVAYIVTVAAGVRGFYVVAGALLAAALLWGDLAALANGAGTRDWLNQNFGPNWGLRIDYWVRIAELTAQHPIIGHGFETGRFLGRPALSPQTAAAVPFMHPHNGMMQIRLEMGVIGVALVTVFFAAAANRLARALESRAALATVTATTTSVSVFWLVSFSAWAGWWLAALALTVAVSILALRRVPSS